MGLFDFLKRPGQRPDEALRDLLFAAVIKDDQATLKEVCDEHEAEVLKSFPTWQTAPPAIRQDKDAMQRYANGLIGLAVYFANERGKPELLERLQGGSAEDNPMNAWANALDEAHRLKEELEFGQAISLVSDLLIDVRGLSGTGVDHFLPRTLGLLGELHFQAGARDNAVTSSEQALQTCESLGDAEGVRAYTGNLYEIHRYFGESGPAAEYAARLAELPGPNNDWYRVQAEIVRAGEPLNRVVVDSDGVRAEVADAEPAGRLSFVFQRNRLGLFASNTLTARGAALGREGKLDEALVAFREAAAADPYDPDPHYQAAITQLYQERHLDAARSYDEVERLAPGWFHCRANAWLATEVAQGRLSHRVLMLVLRLIEGTDDPAKALSEVDEALEEAPQVPLLYLLAGKLHAAQDKVEAAAARFRAGLERRAEDDSRTRLLLQLALTSTDGGEKRELLQQAAELNGNLTAGATAALMLKLA